MPGYAGVPACYKDQINISAILYQKKIVILLLS